MSCSLTMAEVQRSFTWLDMTRVAVWFERGSWHARCGLMGHADELVASGASLADAVVMLTGMASTKRHEERQARAVAT